MTVNPYEPPEAASDLSTQEKLFVDASQVDFAGGNKAILATAAGGAVTMALGLATAMPFFGASFGVLAAFGTPALIWIGTLGGISWTLRNSGVSPLRRIVIASLMAVPAYVIFVPVCTGLTAVSMTSLEPRGMSSMVSMIFGFGGATCASFAGIFAIFAVALRGIYRGRMRRRMRQEGFSDETPLEATVE